MGATGTLQKVPPSLAGGNVGRAVTSFCLRLTGSMAECRGTDTERRALRSLCAHLLRYRSPLICSKHYSLRTEHAYETSPLDC